MKETLKRFGRWIAARAEILARAKVAEEMPTRRQHLIEPLIRYLDPVVLPEFDNDPVCPKCACESFARKFQPAMTVLEGWDFYTRRHQAESINWTCLACGYSFNTATANATP